MKIQKSYIDNGSILYLVPTPIGNLEDMTYRGVRILGEVDYIFCEDTRVTKVLLSHFNIKTPLFKYHSFNEEIVTKTIIEKLSEGENIALVSDAGNPCISDPGYYVSREAILEGYKVVSLPGASASVTALIASGLPSDKFFFHGFLNSKPNKRKKQIEALKSVEETIILYEAPHRIIACLNDLLDILGDRDVVIAREISKKYEEYMRGKLSDIIASTDKIKGEIVIILDGASSIEEVLELNKLSITDHYQYYFEKNKDSKQAMKNVAKDRGISKSLVYKEVIVKEVQN